MKSYQLTNFGKPLQILESKKPKPNGNEVLLKTMCCGICHSDLHIQEGFFDLGGGEKLEPIHKLPQVMGHEIYGEVVEVGEKVSKTLLGKKRVVYPWIGCGACSFCCSKEEQLCLFGKNIGIAAPGGFGEYVLVPDPKYLLDAGSKNPLMSGCFACSGLTSYTALKKVLAGKKRFKKKDVLVFVGLG